MAKEKSKKNEVQSRAKADIKKTDDTNSKNTTKNGVKKTGKKSKAFEDNIIRDSETAKKRGSNGGKKSGEVRRAKKTAREAAVVLLDSMTKNNNIKNNLEELGLKTDDFSNITALFGKVFSMAMGGNLEAFELLMKYAGYEPEENRKERESVSTQARKDMEIEAKKNALAGNVDNANLAINLNDEDGNNDVVIYMPQIKTEDEVQVKSTNKENDNKSEEDNNNK